VSRYALKWLPQGAIPRDVDMKVTMLPAVVPGSDGGGGKCHPAFAGYAVTGSATYNSAESVLLQTWNWPCLGSPWSIVILGFAIGCNGAFTWRHQVDNGPSLEPTLTFIEGVDPIFGGPILTVNGDGSDVCVDTTAVITVNLLLDGDPGFSTSIQLRPTQAPIDLQYLGSTLNSGTAPGEAWFSPNFQFMSVNFSSDPFNITLHFQVVNASSVNWFVDSSGNGAGWTLFYSPGSTTIDFTIDYDGSAGGTSLFTAFYAQDAADPSRYAPGGNAPIPNATLGSS
jgi:hypothetical protein